MAQHYSPKIVTDGLVLCLDAGSRKSYPGSGATWSDLVTRTKTASLTNSPSFSQNNVGSLVFNSASQQFGTLASPGVSGQNLTASIWVFPTTSGTFMTPLTNMTFDSTTTGYAIQQRNNGTFWVSVGIWGVGGDTVSSIPYTTNQWINLTMTYNGATISAYSNGVLFGTTASTRTFTEGTLTVGKGAINASEHFTGNISTVSLYSRALSASEVSQNFNATRGRFGI